MHQRIGAFVTPRIESIFALRIYFRDDNALARHNGASIFLHFPRVDHRLAIANDEFRSFAGSCIDTEYSRPAYKNFGIRSYDSD